MPMVYERVAAFSKLIHIATSFVHDFQNLFETFKRFQEAPKIVDLQLGAPTPRIFGFFWILWEFARIFPDFASNKTNTGVRWIHITTRIETSEKSSPTHE